MPNVIIDPNKCTGCQACISACPNGVFEMQGDKAVVVNPSACDGCRVCEGVCADSAITVTD